MRNEITSLRIDIDNALEKADIDQISYMLLRLYVRRFSLEEMHEIFRFDIKEIDTRIATALEAVAEELGNDYFSVD